MIKPYNDTWGNIIKKLESSKEKGLTSEICEERRKKFGDNKISFKKEKLHILKNIFSFKGLYLLVNFICISFLFYNKAYVESAICFVIFGISAYMKIFILANKNKQIDYIDKLNETNVSVIRDGREKVIKSKELVLGDIINFSKNTLIAGDIRVIEGENIKVDESNVTGEKFIKEKFDYKMDSNPSNIGEISNMIFRGTIIKNGNGKGIVVQTGNNSYLGSMLKSLENTYFKEDKFLDKIDIECTKIYLIILPIIVGIYLLSKNKIFLIQSLFLLCGVSYFSIIFIHLKFIKRKFFKLGIDIKSIGVIEKIKKANVVFLDKIGAITKEEVNIKKVFINLNIINKDKIKYISDTNFKKIIDIICLANNGFYDKEKRIEKGTLTEIEYCKFILSMGNIRDTIKGRNREMFKIEMESDKRFLSILTKGKRGYTLNARGNFEDIINRCEYILIDGLVKELTLELKEKIRINNYNFLTEGLITEGVAYRNFDYKPSERENIESNLVFVGIIGLENKIYEDSYERIKKIKDKNMVPILFTDDHKIAATYLGLKTGIIKSNEEVISGIEIENLKDEEMIKVLCKIRVFSGINLRVKSRIIEIFKNEGYNIIVTGESIGDIASLSIGDVGIAKNTEVKIVKKISDIYIKENYLEKIKFFYKEGIKDLEKVKKNLNIYLANIIFIITMIFLMNTILKVNIAWSDSLVLIIGLYIYNVFIIGNGKVSKIMESILVNIVYLLSILIIIFII